MYVRVPSEISSARVFVMFSSGFTHIALIIHRIQTEFVVTIIVVDHLSEMSNHHILSNIPPLSSPLYSAKTSRIAADEKQRDSTLQKTLRNLQLRLDGHEDMR